MALTKVDYVNGTTVIMAENLNAIQDEIIANGNAIGTQATQIAGKASASDLTAETTAREAADTTLTGEVNDLKSSFNDLFFHTTDVTGQLVKGYYVTNQATGATVPTTLRSSSTDKCGIFTCKKGDVFTITGKGGSTDRTWAFTDSDYKMLSKSASSAQVTELSLTAQQDGYFFFNSEISKNPEVKYTSYMYVTDKTLSESDVPADAKSTGDALKSLDSIIEYGMQKKWGQSDFTQGAWQSRAISVSPNAICINALYPVNAGDVLRIQNNTSGLYFAYGVYVGSSASASDKSGWVTGETHEHVFTVSGKMFFQCVTASAAADRQPITPADMNFDVGIMDNGFVVETAMLSKQILPEKNKTIAFLGDSITAGVGTSKIYHMYLGDRFGWTCRNYGYGGSGYARSYPSTGGKMATGQVGMGVTITSDNKLEPNDFLTRIATIDTAIDGLVIFGGTNDWAHGDVISVDAFKTAVNNVFTYAQTHFGRIPIIVLLPIHRGNDSTPNATTGKTLEDYCDIIKTIAIPYGIRCIDLFAESGLNPANQHNNDLYYIRDDTSVSDSLHPNHYAHKMISNIIASALYDELY